MQKPIRILTLALASASIAGAAFALDSHAVKGYAKRDGTVVAPSVATNPNATRVDNFGSKGNVNPATGKTGTVDPYSVPLLKDARSLR